MITYLRRLTIRHVASPQGLAAISYGIFLLAWATPPSIYTEFIGEPDVLYLNPVAMFFYSLCILMFLAGSALFQCWRSSSTASPLCVSTGSPLLFLLMPLGISSALCAASVVILGDKLSNLAGLLLSQQGALIKLAGASGQAEEGSWGYVLTIHTGVLWWAYSRSCQLQLRGTLRLAFRVSFAVAALLGVLTAFIKVDRTNLIPILAGLCLIYLHFRATTRGISVARLVCLCAGSTAGVLLTFIGISYIRGASDLRLVAIALLGYTAASYNRMAAELIGLLHYSFGGHGLYLSTFLAFNNTVNRIIPFNDWMGGANQRQVYFSEFSSIAAGGLNPGFNWPGAFGYLFADLGWWTPLYLFPVGIMSAYLWRCFVRRTVAGIVLYPWVAFSILFWFGWNVLFDLRLALLVVALAVLALYEGCLLRKSHVLELAPV